MQFGFVLNSTWKIKVEVILFQGPMGESSNSSSVRRSDTLHFPTSGQRIHFGRDPESDGFVQLGRKFSARSTHLSQIRRGLQICLRSTRQDWRLDQSRAQGKHSTGLTFVI